jgi:hypothetical protein
MDIVYLLLLLALFGLTVALIPAFERLIDRKVGVRK